MKVLGWSFTILISVLMCAFLELNHHTILGWLLFIAAAAALVFCGRKYMGTWKWWQKGLSVLGYLALCACIILVSWPPVRRVPASNSRNPGKTDVYETAYGDVRGVVLDSGVELFAGIPYAAPPVGELRWKKPQDPEPWSSVLECDTFAPMSMQVQNLPFMGSMAQIIGYRHYRFSLHDNYRAANSEDSLYLNIWKPAGSVEKAPVAVYIHGGSLQTGQTWFSDYSGEGFAKDGIITVNMGYRLGVFGFLATEEMLEEEGTAGNFGLLDQIKALEWVRDNIEHFGGDPDNVTIIGESAGAVCVDALCVSSLAKGLFRRAVMESSTASSPEPPHSYRLFEAALASGKALMERHGCSSLEELRQLPAETLVSEQASQHHITIDGYVLTDTPYHLRKQGIHNEEAVIHGFNKEESGPFIIFNHAKLKDYEGRIRRWFGEYADEVLELYHPETDEQADEYWARIYGAMFFNYSHYCLNRLENENHVPAWEYLFSKDNKGLGSWHSGELPYVFGMLAEDSKAYTNGDRDLSAIMHGYWANFIRTGEPNDQELQAFEQSEDSSKLLEFGNSFGMTRVPELELYGILDRMYGWNDGNE
ncbi:MAG: carboxylesterase family protein [Solobacterium sp.]|nr:carboxylesterase family protein [Solobacterium sp.]